VRVRECVGTDMGEVRQVGEAVERRQARIVEREGAQRRKGAQEGLQAAHHRAGVVQGKLVHRRGHTAM
jgi:hypothetical protein